MIRLTSLLGGTLGVVQWLSLYIYLTDVIDAYPHWRSPWYLPLTVGLGALGGVLFTRVVAAFDFQRWWLRFSVAELNAALAEWIPSLLLGLGVSALAPMMMARGFNRGYRIDEWLLVVLECGVAWPPLLLASQLRFRQPRIAPR